MGVFVQRPGHAQSFPIPFAGMFLSTVAMPSIHVFERQIQVTPLADLWRREAQIALPNGADDESIDLGFAMAVQRGYSADTQISSGIRSGTLSLRGQCGWKAKMGWDQNGGAIYAEGQALTMHLRGFFVQFAKFAADSTAASVRLVYRNLDTAEAYIVRPDKIRIGRGGENPIHYEWDLTFEIIRPIEPDPFLPGWMAAVDSAFDLYTSYSMTAAGAMETLAVIAEGVSRVTGAAVDTILAPLTNTATVLRHLGEATRSIYTVPAAAIQSGIDACYELSVASREMATIIRGEVSDSTVDPDADDDRDRWGSQQYSLEMDCSDAAHDATEVAMAAFAAQEPGIDPPVIVQPGDDISTLPGRLGRTVEQLFAEMGVAGPIVDAEQILPGSLWPGAPISLNPSAPEGSPAGTAAQVVDETTIYGVNFRLYDGDLVPEFGGDPEDVQLVAGQANLTQGLGITIDTIRGHNLTFPGLGIDAPIGEPSYLAPLVHARAIEAVLEDDRVKSVEVDESDLNGDTVPIGLRILPWGIEGLAIYASTAGAGGMSP